MTSLENELLTSTENIGFKGKLNYDLAGKVRNIGANGKINNDLTGKMMTSVRTCNFVTISLNLCEVFAV